MHHYDIFLLAHKKFWSFKFCCFVFDYYFLSICVFFSYKILTDVYSAALFMSSGFCQANTVHVTVFMINALFINKMQWVFFLFYFIFNLTTKKTTCFIETFTIGTDTPSNKFPSL